ncbi:hypothetical protein PVK06_005594 [Gossypium arboreum]|uniref:Uncharacterized protein n=1 Tax=Gossypium arboreum TaxID=29729 RepID=A0ABR0QUZ3_GOSAR|nr:hypothetical protein PVK06_005594 [Gossypium arboreum]
MKVVAVYLLAVLRGNASPSTDDLKVILGSGAGELYFIIMEAASCSLELCEELRRKEDAIARGMIMGAAASTEKYLYRSGVGQSRSSAGIKLTIVVCL